MKKIQLIMMVLLFTLISTIDLSAQWTNRTIDSDFDGLFKRSYTESNNNGSLIMEVGISKTFTKVIYDTIKLTDTIYGYIPNKVGSLDSLDLYGDGNNRPNIYIRKEPILKTSLLGELSDEYIILSDTLYNGKFYKVMDIHRFKVNVKSIDTTIKFPSLALYGLYFCDDETKIDIVFIVNGIRKKYTVKSYKSKDSRLYIFPYSIWSEDFINDFKKASVCKIRVNQSHCENDYYTFNFNGSSSSYNFIID